MTENIEKRVEWLESWARRVEEHREETEQWKYTAEQLKEELELARETIERMKTEKEAPTTWMDMQKLDTSINNYSIEVRSIPSGKGDNEIVIRLRDFEWLVEASIRNATAPIYKAIRASKEAAK